MTFWPTLIEYSVEAVDVREDKEDIDGTRDLLLLLSLRRLLAKDSCGKCEEDWLPQSHTIKETSFFVACQFFVPKARGCWNVILENTSSNQSKSES